MEYIIIPSGSKSETAFFLNLMKKMQKEVSTLSKDEMEDFALMRAIKEGEKTPKGDLNRVKNKLHKIANGL